MTLWIITYFKDKYMKMYRNMIIIYFKDKSNYNWCITFCNQQNNFETII